MLTGIVLSGQVRSRSLQSKGEVIELREREILGFGISSGVRTNKEIRDACNLSDSLNR